MNIDNYTADLILSISKDNVEKIFYGDENTLKKTYKKLSLIWHPDKLKDKNHYNIKVFPHINELYQIALNKYKTGKLSLERNCLNIKDSKNNEFIFRYKIQKNFELGKYYISEHYVLWQFNKEYKEDALRGLVNLTNITFYDDNMKLSFSKYVPEIKKKIISEDSLFVLMNKPKGFLNLGDVLKFQNKIEPKHVAWILSTLYNNICFIHFNKIMHGGISVDNYFINPETHEGMLIGGWWYSTLIGEKLNILPQKAIDVAPVSLLNKKEADFLLDLEMIKSLGRELLGDHTGIYLNKDKNIPKELIKWLRDGSKGSAVMEYSTWSKKILPESFGERRFSVMNIKSTDIYREV